MSLIECKVCYDEYNKEELFPLAFHCGHSFCKRCILQLIRHADGVIIKCPSCRFPLDISDGRPGFLMNINLEEIARIVFYLATQYSLKQFGAFGKSEQIFSIIPRGIEAIYQCPDGQHEEHIDDESSSQSLEALVEKLEKHVRPDISRSSNWPTDTEQIPHGLPYGATQLRYAREMNHSELTSTIYALGNKLMIGDQRKQDGDKKGQEQCQENPKGEKNRQKENQETSPHYLQDQTWDRDDQGAEEGDDDKSKAIDAMEVLRKFYDGIRTFLENFRLNTS